MTTLKKAALEIQHHLLDEGEDSIVELHQQDGIETMHVRFIEGSGLGEIFFTYHDPERRYLKFTLIDMVGKACQVDNVYTLERFLQAMPINVALIHRRAPPMPKIGDQHRL